MILKRGNMFEDSSANMIFCTTNGVIKRDGTLVMGAGAAKEMRDRFPGVDKFFGDKAKQQGVLKSEFPSSQTRAYGLIYGRHCGGFQTKYHFNNKSDIGLIQFSTERLLALANQHPQLKFAVNFPGIGHGGLSRDEVMKVIQILPNNVEVWLKK